MSRLIWAMVFVGALLCGCNLRNEPSRMTSVPATVLPLRQTATPIPADLSDTARMEALPASPTADETVSSLPYACGNDDGDRSARQVDAHVAIDYEAKTVAVDERVAFLNREDSALESIVLDVQSNQWEGAFELLELLVYGAPAYYAFEANKLEIPLAIALPPGCETRIELRFRLRPERIRDGLRAYRGFFGYSPRQLNLGHFLPTVAARLGGEWRIHEPAGIGEQIVYDVTDWRVTVEVEDASDAMRMAAAGTVNQVEPGLWHVEHPRSRDFVISLSEGYIVREGETVSGVRVSVYAFGEVGVAANVNGVDGASHVLQETIKALELFERLFGAYPYERFAVVQADFPDGMEFTGLVFVGSAWFSSFDGTNRNYLTLIAVHEIAHQWWYARIGSDAALHPWLDEALATYSEYLFIEALYPADKNWWWSFRVAQFHPQGDVDSVVYEFRTAREYINAIYLRGAQMMHNLREDIGDEAFFNWLRTYAESGSGQIAHPQALWSALSPQQAELTRGTRKTFLRDPSADSFFSDEVSQETRQGA